MDKEDWKECNDISYKINELKLLLTKIQQNKAKEFLKGYIITTEGNEGVHRIVAKSFLPNYNNLPEVDHIDRNPSNNNIKNLRWSSKEDNLNNRGGKFEGVKVNKFKLSNKSIKKYIQNMKILDMCDYGRDIIPYFIFKDLLIYKNPNNKYYINILNLYIKFIKITDKIHNKEFENLINILKTNNSKDLINWFKKSYRPFWFKIFLKIDYINVKELNILDDEYFLEKDKYSEFEYMSIPYRCDEREYLNDNEYCDNEDCEDCYCYGIYNRDKLEELIEEYQTYIINYNK